MNRPLRYTCPACKLPQSSLRCALCGGDCEPTEPILGALPDSPPLTLSPFTERQLTLQTALSQWLYGRMMDEDSCTSLLRIARTSAHLWHYMSTPAASRTLPPSLWHQALYSDAVFLFGHHFPIRT